MIHLARGMSGVRQGVAVALLGASLAAAPLGAHGAEITSDKGKRGERPLIQIAGEIRDGDLAKFRRLALTYDDAIVVLSSEGGQVAEALEIGKVIRIKGYDTFVGEDPCDSACALIWLAGRTRFLAEDGRVGFHATYIEKGGRKQETGVGNAFVGAYLSQLNMSEAALAFTTSASPDRLNILTAKNAESVGIPIQVIHNEEGKPESERKAPVGTWLYKKVGNWSVGVDDTLGRGCFAFVEYDDDVAFRVGLDPRGEKLSGYAMLFGASWKSIERRAEYPIEITFGGTPAWSLTAHGTQMGPLKGIVITFDRSRFFDSVSKASDMRVRYRNTEVAHLSLEGGSAAIDAMVQCQKAQDRAANDPFAKAQDSSSRDPFAR